MKNNWFTRILWLISGILMIVAGIFCFIYPIGTLWYLAFIMGVVMLLSGILDIVMYARMGHLFPGSGWVLADGILTIILALFVLGNQYITAVNLPFVFGIWVIFSGITRLINSTEIRRAGAQGWGWMIAHGILDILFGMFCFIEPAVGSIAIGILVGVSFLLQGVFSLFQWWFQIWRKQ